MSYKQTFSDRLWIVTNGITEGNYQSRLAELKVMLKTESISDIAIWMVENAMMQEKYNVQVFRNYVEKSAADRTPEQQAVLDETFKEIMKNKKIREKKNKEKE